MQNVYCHRIVKKVECVEFCCHRSVTKASKVYGMLSIACPSLFLELLLNVILERMTLGRIAAVTSPEGSLCMSLFQRAWHSGELMANNDVPRRSVSHVSEVV